MENNEQKKRFDLKRTAKNIGKAAAGAGLAASMFFGSMFSSPQEIVKPEEVPSPAAIIQQAAPPEAEPVFALDSETADDEEKRTLRRRIRDWLMRMPIGLRLLIFLPIWAVGFGIVWGISALTGAFSLPVLGAVLKFAAGALAAFGTVLLAQKLIFPDVPIKDLLSKRNLTGLLVTAGVIALGGAVGGLLRSDLPWLSAAIVCAAVGLYALFFLLFVRQPKKQ